MNWLDRLFRWWDWVMNWLAYDDPDSNYYRDQR